MSILKYFKPSLPTPSQTGIGDGPTAAANREVEQITSVDRSERKRKRYAIYSDEDHANIGRYAAENGNIAALKRYKCEHQDLVESTVRCFKNKYLAAVKEKHAAQDYTDVAAIPSKRQGRPLSLGEIDSEVQQYLERSVQLEHQ